MTARKPTAAADRDLAISATIRAIPRGRVSTYGAVAKAAGFPRHARHVAKVLQYVHDLPWQRVLASGGRIALPGEHGFEQRFLLQTEGVGFRGRRVDLSRYEHHFPASPRRPSTAKKPSSRQSGKPAKTRRVQS